VDSQLPELVLNMRNVAAVTSKLSAIGHAMRKYYVRGGQSAGLFAEVSGFIQEIESDPATKASLLSQERSPMWVLGLFAVFLHTSRLDRQELFVRFRG
jgi:hypothetical protein